MHRLVRAALLIPACLLSGCGIFHQEPPGCQTSFQAGGSWKIGSFQLPLGQLAPGQKIELSGVEYNADQVKQLTDAAQTLEQVRLSGCAALYANTSQSAKDKASEAVTAAMNAMLTFATSIGSARTPDQGVAAATQAKEVAKDTLKGVPAVPGKTSLSEPPASVDWGKEIETAKKAAATSSAEIAAQLEVLKRRIDTAHHDPQHFEIDGFAKGSDALPTGRLGELAGWFDSAVRSVPPDRQPLVVIVGYTDSSGKIGRNLQLGLKRAARVRQFLDAQMSGRPIYSQITTGGVLGSDASARRVQVVVS